MHGRAISKKATPLNVGAAFLCLGVGVPTWRVYLDLEMLGDYQLSYRRQTIYC